MTRIPAMRTGDRRTVVSLGSEHRVLSQDQIDFYHRSGYLAVPAVLSQDETAELQRVTDEMVEQARSITESDAVFELEPGHTPESPRVGRIKRPSLRHRIYNSMLHHDTILDIVAQLIGPSIRYTGEKLNMKSAGFGSVVEWHQDWGFMPHTNDDLLAVGIAIDDMTTDNGALLVIPGSHRRSIYDHHQDGMFVGAVGHEYFDPASAVAIELPAGGISIHHIRTLHGSAPNVSNRSRRMLFLELAAADAWPLSGLGDWDTWSTWDEYNACLLRGDPVTEPRLVDVPVRLPHPARPWPGSIFALQSDLRSSPFSPPS